MPKYWLRKTSMPMIIANWVINWTTISIGRYHFPCSFFCMNILRLCVSIRRSCYSWSEWFLRWQSCGLRRCHGSVHELVSAHLLRVLYSLPVLAIIRRLHGEGFPPPAQFFYQTRIWYHDHYRPPRHEVFVKSNLLRKLLRWPACQILMQKSHIFQCV